MKKSRIEQLNETEKQYLQYFAILPPKALTIAELMEVFEMDKWQDVTLFDVLYDLSVNGWLLRNENRFEILPLTKEYVLKRIPPAAKDCQPVIETFVNKLYYESDENKDNLKQYVSYSKSIVDAFHEPTEQLVLLTNNLYVTLRFLGRFEEAITYNLKNIAFEKKLYGINHPNLADSYYNIAITYAKTGDLKKSLEYNLRAVEIRERILDANHPDLGRSYNSISITYSRLKNYEKSLEYGLKSLDISEKDENKSLRLIGSNYYNLALIYFNMNDFKEAVNYINKAVEAHKKVLPEEHPDLLDDLETQKQFYLHYKISTYVPIVFFWIARVALLSVLAVLLYWIVVQ